MNFVAQSLDNEGPMLLASGRQLLSEGDPRRQQVVDETSETAANGRRTPIADNVVIYERSGVFALKVYPQARDSAGRRAPILASVLSKDVTARDWPDRALKDITWFAHTTGRPLDESLRNATLAGLRAIQNQRASHTRKRFALALTTLTLLLAILTWWMGL